MEGKEAFPSQPYESCGLSHDILESSFKMAAWWESTSYFATTWSPSNFAILNSNHSPSKRGINLFSWDISYLFHPALELPHTRDNNSSISNGYSYNYNHVSQTRQSQVSKEDNLRKHTRNPQARYQSIQRSQEHRPHCIWSNKRSASSPASSSFNLIGWCTKSPSLANIPKVSQESAKSPNFIITIITSTTTTNTHST